MKENNKKCYVGILLMLVVIIIGLNQYYNSRLIPFEIEGSCNTGFIGIDFQSTFDNQPYNQKIAQSTTFYQNGTIEEKDVRFNVKYDREFLLKQLNLKNIDGLNCNFKVKGAIPLNKL